MARGTDTSDPTVSVVIVSRGRPQELLRCLLGVSQLQYAPFEVVVVADPGGAAAVADSPFSASVKCEVFDVPNISAARNIGIGHAAGEIIAFIDDDAVPEPQWLRYLTAPAKHPQVAAMGGFVRGRNGISFQWKAHRLDAQGLAQAVDVDPERATVLHPPPGTAIKTEGTNMAFRREVLVALGGFDPAFHYFLDETDLNMRVARAGHATAIVPLAEVHHGFAANRTRSRDRVPSDLFDIGASWAVFQRRHIPESERATHWEGQRNEQSRRALRHMVGGGLEPRDVRLMRRLDDGYAAGYTRPLDKTGIAAHPKLAFKPFPALRRPSELICTRPLTFRRDHRRAVERVKAGGIVTLLNLSATALYHDLRFTNNGFWLQNGGVFGRSDRDQPVFQLTTRVRRTLRERHRVAEQRGLKGV